MHVMRKYNAKTQMICIFFIKSWLLFSKFFEKTRFSQVVATEQDSIYKSFQLSAVKKYSVRTATYSLAASWRYVGTLEQCYRTFSIILYWVSHRHTISKNGSIASYGIALG